MGKVRRGLSMKPIAKCRWMRRRRGEEEVDGVGRRRYGADCAPNMVQ